MPIYISDLERETRARQDAAERRRAAARTRIESILDGATAQGRAHLTRAEDAEVGELHAERDRAKAELVRIGGQLAEINKAIAEQADWERANLPENIRDTEAVAIRARARGGADADYAIGSGRTSTPLRDGEAPWVRSADGRRATLARGQSWRDHDTVQEYAEARAAVERPVTETYGGLGQLVRALSTTTGSSIVPTTWTSKIIDKARNYAAVLAAGTEIVPMPSKVVQVGRLTADPASAFRAEGSAVTAADPSFDSVTLTATTLSCLTVASMEFLQDAINADAVIEDSIAKSMALQLDLVCLYGSITTGAEGLTLTSPPNPRGILGNLLANLAGNVLGSATNGTPITAATPWQEVLQTIYQVRRGNEVPTALLWPVRLQQGYANRYDTLNQPLRQPDDVAQMNKISTNQLSSGMTQGTGTNMCDMVAGDFTKALLGQRLDFSLRILTERYAELGQVGIESHWRGDFQLARPGAFCWFRYLAGVSCSRRCSSGPSIPSTASPSSTLRARCCRRGQPPSSRPGTARWSPRACSSL